MFLVGPSDSPRALLLTPKPSLDRVSFHPSLIYLYSSPPNVVVVSSPPGVDGPNPFETAI